jgi:DNA-directed RNA polymerase specialized sigma24 family protein
LERKSNLVNILPVEKYSDKTILTGIKNRKDYILEYLYRDYFPKVKHIVISNGGNEQDARDLFQEALIIVFSRLKKNDLIIKSSFHNFFIVLCKFIWYRQNNTSHNHARVEDIEEKSVRIHPGSESSAEFPGESVYREHTAAAYEKFIRGITGNYPEIAKRF